MKPDPSSSSGENPQSSRPETEKENRSLLAGEADLWDFGDDDENPGKPPAKPVEEEPAAREETPNPAMITLSPRGPKRDSMPFKQAPSKKKSETPEESPEESGTASDTDTPVKHPRKGVTPGLKPVEDAFDDLEASADDVSEPTPEPAVAPAAQETPPEKSATPAATPEKPSAEATTERKGLLKIEKIGLISFLVLFLAGGLFFVAHSIRKLPEEKKTLTEGDFPIKGSKVETRSFKSFWRDPVASGSGADTVRRGTIIIPVVELQVSGKGAVRVFFRNSEGDTVGDAVSRAVTGEATLTLPATAGFDEPGMYAAYRTRETKPWKVEVFEGPSADAAGSEFKKLFEIPISTNRR